MKLLSGQDAQRFLEGLVYAKTQVGTFWVDLTVNRVERLTKRGSLDFGGSEFSPATTAPLTAHKRKDDDKYGWWELRHGMYLIRYNESLLDLPDDHAVLLTPHPRLTSAGSSHTSSYLFAGDELTVVLDIPQAGCALKENCRISRLQLFEL